MIVTEAALTESRSIRDSQLANTTHERAEDVLSKAKALLHFAMYQGNKIASTETIAEFYDASEATVRQTVKRHYDEFELDGLKVLRGKALKDVRDALSLTSDTPQATAWTPRAALRLGMLLRDSEVAKAVRTALLDEAEESGKKSERIEELKLERDIAQANAATTSNQLRVVERTESIVVMHGLPNALALLGRSNEIVEVEKPTLEVIEDKHKTHFKGQTLKQVAQFVAKRYGIRLKDGGSVKKILKLAEKDNLVAHVPRAVVSEYIPQEHLEEVYKILTDGSRQMMLGE